MIAAMRLREFFTCMAPATRERIAHDCGLADADDMLDALVAYSQRYGLGVTHWHVRYPELVQDRGFSPATTHICHPAPTDWRGLQADAVEFPDQEPSR